MVKLHYFLMEKDLIWNIAEPQNQVMYLHALAIHQVYNSDDLKKAWTPLFKMIAVTKLSEYDTKSNAYHRTLALALELFEIDNPQLFKKYTG